MESEEHTTFLNSGQMVVQNSRWGEVTVESLKVWLVVRWFCVID